MSTADENLNEVQPEDYEIPTQIHDSDEKIKRYYSQISEIQKLISEETVFKNRLLQRAKQFHISNDKNYKIIEIPIYGDRCVDIPRLKQLITFEDYRKILKNIEERLNQKYVEGVKKSEEFISQSDVKAVVKDKVILMQVIVTPSEPERYEISITKV
jgi:predicted ATP-grasp superfamily ATP-dependent carboligase